MQNMDAYYIFFMRIFSLFKKTTLQDEQTEELNQTKPKANLTFAPNTNQNRGHYLRNPSGFNLVSTNSILELAVDTTLIYKTE